MKIMVFLHGTTIMHRSAISRSRIDRVRQVLENEEPVHDFSSYVPVGGSPQKVQSWTAQGAEVVYLSSHRRPEDIEKDRSVLKAHQFPEGEICFRKSLESYADIAEKVLPDILIEDDCQSIGGEAEMTYPHISAAKQTLIKHIVVREFEGIDHLPDDLASLANYSD
ncbi:MAG: hypothetical protein MUO58_00975 [Anaerolineales bacterium]|nr:hypothetical protein [Anaerolineales bacterium]HUS85242.1 hypothetical protein [Anaerolineales bacterium]